MDAKAVKCILVGYSNEQKGYKCYNPRTKQACVSRDVVFDESTSPPTPDLDSNLSSDNEVSEAEMPPDEPEIMTREESLISFRLSGPNGRLNRLSRGDDLRATKKKKRRCRFPAWTGTSRIDANPTPKKAVTGLRERSLRRSRRPRHRLMSNYDSLPARRTR